MRPDTATRNAVGVVFLLNGLAFACLVSRLPDIRAGLELSNSGLGLLLLVISAGSLVALAASGRLVSRHGARVVVRLGAIATLVGLVVAAAGVATSSVLLTGLGFVGYGLGSGAWDVAMNVEAAEVERRLGRSVMPRFHAGWSVGTFVGAGIGVLLTGLDVPASVHLGGGALLACGVAVVAAERFLQVTSGTAADGRPRTRVRSAWREPRTLAIGVMVLCFAAIEGTANDWLTLALIDGYDAPKWLGVAGFALFVSAMTAGRMFGPAVLDRRGRVPVLVASALLAAGGVVLVVHGVAGPVVALGVLCWGLGAAVGFPVGMSAAADDPARAAARVSVVAAIGYGAFLTGPPLLGALADAVGTLESLLAVVGLAVVALGAVAAVAATGSESCTELGSGDGG